MGWPLSIADHLTRLSKPVDDPAKAGGGRLRIGLDADRPEIAAHDLHFCKRRRAGDAGASYDGGGLSKGFR